MVYSMKIFGLGLSRTGTTSLGEALEILGFSCIHYPHDEKTYSELAQGRYELSIMSKYDSATDISVAPFFPQLDEVYPGSKFILTVREESSWLRSLENHFSEIESVLEDDAQFKCFADFINAAVYGTLVYSKARMKYARQNHHRAIIHYFSDRPDDLLIMNICAGDGWDNLVSFLGKPMPEIPFPSKNHMSVKKDWDQRVSTVHARLCRILGSSKKIILVDDNQLAGAFTATYDVLPFLEKNNRYAGRPASDRVAIEELERMRSSSACFLIFVWSAFWWFTCYPEFHSYIREKFTVIAEDIDMVVYRL